ncbi:hypothetical protein IT417_00170 [bacterium]|nr:hypothetical protein [bacterium]
MEKLELKPALFLSFLRFVLYIPLSWVLVHLFSIFGLFVAAAYPIWWLFFPKSLVCFSCRSREDGQMCRLCHEKVLKSQGVEPKTLTSSLYNGLLVFMVTVLSVAVVFIERQVIESLGLIKVPKTVSFVIPDKSQYKIGEIFPMKIEISGVKTPINAVQADLAFDPEKIEVVDITTSESFANVFIQKEINNETGYSRLTGGLPHPGFDKESGVFGTVYFKSKSAGLTQVKFLPTSMVLANDGKGTNIIKEFPVISYVITSERVTTAEEELQNSVLGKEVLGTQDNPNQLVLFQDDVLGIDTEKLQGTIDAIAVIDKGVDWLLAIDTFIVTAYSKVLTFFGTISLK